jgi:hypothetical protein
MGEQPVADPEATEADRADAGRSALTVGVDAPVEWTPAGTGATAFGHAHTAQANARDLV